MSPLRAPKALLGPIRGELIPSCKGVPGIACIYRITCLRDNRHYIGQTTDAARRWLEHQADLHQGKHTNPGLQDAFNHHGPTGLTFSIMHRLPARYDEGLYALAEQRFIDMHRGLNRNSNSLFNVRPAGTDRWLKSTAAGRQADQAERRRRLGRNQGNFHRKNRDHL